jgi:ankyrin repeat protein
VTLFTISVLYILQAVFKRQYTALGIAGFFARAACVTLLIEAGAEVNYQTKEVYRFADLKVSAF